VINVPDQVTVHDRNQLVRRNTYAPRPNYFAAPPTTAVQNNQVNPIANADINVFLGLVAVMEKQTIGRDALNVNLPLSALRL
jgi:hypothetical protein